MEGVVENLNVHITFCSLKKKLVTKLCVGGSDFFSGATV